MNENFRRIKFSVMKKKTVSNDFAFNLSIVSNSLPPYVPNKNIKKALDLHRWKWKKEL